MTPRQCTPYIFFQLIFVFLFSYIPIDVSFAATHDFIPVLYNGSKSSKNNNDQLKWAKSLGSVGVRSSKDVAVYSQDNSIYVIGYFYNIIYQQESEELKPILTSIGGSDIFIAKYAADGNQIWLKSAGGEMNDYGYGIGVDSSGGAVIVGTFEHSAIIGRGENNETSLATSIKKSTFIAKYSPHGTLIWAKSVTGDISTVNNCMSLNSTDGSFYLTGTFTGRAIFGTGEANEKTLISSNSTCGDVYIAKYNKNGMLAWVYSIAGNGNRWCNDISVNESDGTVTLTGLFENDALFDLNGPHQKRLTSFGSYDMFIAKYQANGNFAWATQAGGYFDDVGKGISVIYSDGTSIVTGNFLRTAIFGFGEPNKTVLNSSPWWEDDIFIAKYNSDGTLQWAKRTGGYGSDQSYAVSVRQSDSSFCLTGYLALYSKDIRREEPHNDSVEEGNFLAEYKSNGVLSWIKHTEPGPTYSIVANTPDDSIITASSFAPEFLFKYSSNGSIIWKKENSPYIGYFKSNAISSDEDDGGIFITGSAHFYSTNYPGNDGILLLKYDIHGEILWSKIIQDSRGSGEGASVDSSDDSIIVFGNFYGEILFGAGGPNEITLSSSNTFNRDIFIAKYTSEGTFVWAKQAGGPLYDDGTSIRMNALDGSSVVAGEFKGSILLGAGEPNETTLVASSPSDWDVFIAKYRADGSLSWAKRASSDWSSGLDINPTDGSSIVTGRFSGAATFGFGEPNETTLDASGFWDEIFIAKYFDDGTLAWAKMVGNVDSDWSSDIWIDPVDGSFAITGFFNDIIVFGAGEPQETTLTATNYSEDTFIAKFNADGTLIWAKKAGSNKENGGTGVSINSIDSCINLTGHFRQDVTFGEGEQNEITLYSSGYHDRDIFIVQYNDDGTLCWAQSAGGDHYDRSSDISTHALDAKIYITGFFSYTAVFGSGQENETTLLGCGYNDFTACYGF